MAPKKERAAAKQSDEADIAFIAKVTKPTVPLEGSLAKLTLSLVEGKSYNLPPAHQKRLKELESEGLIEITNNQE